MANEINDPRKVVTPPCRISFPHLFSPRAVNPGDEPVYSCALLFDDEADLKPLRDAVMFAAKDRFGEKAKDVLKRQRHPIFRKQSEKDTEGYADKGMFITTKSKDRPGVVDARLQDIIEPTDVQAGMIVRASLRAYAWEHPSGGKGVSLGLQNVMVTKDDGTRWSGRSKAQDDFAGMNEVEDDEDAETAVETSDDDGESWY